MIDIEKSYISVGATASLTGRYAVQGSQSLAGIQAWVEDTNRSGGILLNETSSRLPVTLTFYDDESSPTKCEALAERLIADDNVDILIGPYSSGLALRAAAAAEKHRRVLWNHGGSAEIIFSRGFEWVVGVLTPDSQYFHGVIDYFLNEHLSPRNVAIVHSTAGMFPREVASGAESYCRHRGFAAINVHQYPTRTNDFTPILKQLHEQQPDLILEVGRIEDDIRFAQQLIQFGLTAATIGLIAAPLTMFGESLGRDSDGFIGPSQWEPGVIAASDYGPTSEQIMKSLTGRHAAGVDYPMAQAYAGCLIAQKCIETAGSLDNHALRQAANGLDFTTFYGRFKIGPATGRQLGHEMPIIQWQNGIKRVVWPHR